MEITHAIFSLTVGGLETMLVNIANIQARAGHNVRIIVLTDNYDRVLVDAISPRIKTILIDRPVGSRNPWYIIKLNILLSQCGGPIHIHEAHMVKLLMPSLRKRLCMTQHTVANDYQLSSLPRIHHRIAISQLVADDLDKRLHLDSTVIVNGIMTDRFRRRQPRAAVLTPGDSYRIVCVGRLRHNIKGQHLLIEAIAQLRQKGYNNITADLWGDGESHDYLAGLIRSLGLDGAVNLRGLAEPAYLEEHLCEYDLAVQPSLYEGFGLTVAEAMAANVPVLVSDTMGPYEVVEQGRCGRTFVTGDSGSLAGAIARMMAQPDDTAMLDRATERVLKLYDVAVTARKYVDYYRTFIS